MPPLPDGGASAPAALPRADVGVLLVHGIGGHGEADTLLGFGEPLIDWLREWLAGGKAGHTRGHLRVSQARLRALRTEGESPAFALVDIGTRSGAEASGREQWLFAEAWWGNSVQAPGAVRLFAWMFTRLPLLVMWHYFGGRRAEASPEPPGGAPAAPAPRGWDTPVPNWVAVAAKVVAAPLLILVMQLVVLLALVLWIVPFGPWRQAVLSVMRALTLTLGDSYVLLEQDVQRAALVDRVASCLSWLHQRVDRVVVIAHSQGGAIAHDALTVGDPVELLITVGSGLEKLEFLRLVRERRLGVLSAAVAAPCVTAGLLGLLAGAAGWIDTSSGWWVVPVLLLAFTAIVAMRLFAVLAPYRQRLEQVLAASPVARGVKARQWWDVHASLDLVPMGAASLQPRDASVHTVELRNECSLISDHVTYFDSRCGFAAWCWPTLARLSRLPLFGPGDLADLRQIGLWHGRRAFALGFGTGLAPLAVACAALVFTDAMAALGLGLYDALDGASMTRTRDALQWIMEFLARGLLAIPGAGAEPGTITRLGQILMAAAAGVGAVALWWAAVVALWRSDGRARWRSLCRGQSMLVGKHAAWSGVPMTLGWTLAAMLPLWAVLLAARSPEALTLGSLGRATAAVFAVFMVFVALFGALVMPWIDMQGQEKAIVGRFHRPLWPLFTAAGMAFYGFLAQMSWRLATSTELHEAVIACGIAGCALSWSLAWSRRDRGRVWTHGVVWGLPVVAAVAVRVLADASWPLQVLAVHLLVTLLVIGLLRWRYP